MDVLALVALCLAVLAFLVQIFVFIVQTFSSNQQLLRAEQLNGSTARALATIEEKAEGTRLAVARLDDRILAAAFGQAEKAATDKGIAFDRLAVSQAFQQIREVTHPPDVALPVDQFQEPVVVNAGRQVALIA